MSYNRVKKCRYGIMIYNQNDAYIGRSLDLYGEFSESEVELFRQMARPGDVVVEVGANIGAHTVFLAAAVGPAGRVIAIEPQRVIYQTLCGNMAINSLDNVLCLNAAAGEQPGSITVPALNPRVPSNFGGLSIQGHRQGETVPLITLDSLNLQRCKLIKVDVEGMEHSVLSGAKETIARTRPLLYVENDRADRSAALLQLIDSLDYDIYPHNGLLFNPNNFAGNAENVFGRIVSINLFCTPRGKGIKINGVTPLAINNPASPPAAT